MSTNTNMFLHRIIDTHVKPNNSLGLVGMPKIQIYRASYVKNT